ncbi:MAG: phage baseplate assembly protein V [Verrucomicrobiota bacterium]
MNLLEVLAPRDEISPDHDRVYGAVVGVVSSIDDPENLGRVRVQFPWLKEDLESRWARLVSFMAGPDRGGVFRPEVGDEVLVLFEHGDLRFPYIIGGLWNGQDAMPSERGADGGNDIRLIKSRSGHTIILDDTSGSEKITVTDKGGNSVELSSSGVVIKSSAIKVGSSGASESMVLGDAFMQLFNSHTHGTGVGPSSPPTQPMSAGQHVSTKHKTE